MPEAKALSKAFAGAGAVEWLMAYRPDATADYVGLQRITGTLAGTLSVQSGATLGGSGISQAVPR